MSNKEKLNELKSQLLELNEERSKIMSPNENGVVYMTINEIIVLKGLELKIKKVSEDISALLPIISQEEREASGYTVFGKYINEEGKYVMDSRVIPYHLKEKFQNEFDISNSPTFPSMSDIDNFLEVNVK